MCKTFMKKVIKILSKNITYSNKMRPIMMLMGKTTLIKRSLLSSN